MSQIYVQLLCLIKQKTNLDKPKPQIDANEIRQILGRFQLKTSQRISVKRKTPHRNGDHPASDLYCIASFESRMTCKLPKTRISWPSFHCCRQFQGLQLKFQLMGQNLSTINLTKHKINRLISQPITISTSEIPLPLRTIQMVHISVLVEP